MDEILYKLSTEEESFTFETTAELDAVAEKNKITKGQIGAFIDGLNVFNEPFNNNLDETLTRAELIVEKELSDDE